MDMHELVGAYALDALSDDERAAFEAHLATCDACQAELASFADAVDGLADDGESSEVPAGLAERIAAELAVTPQDAASAATAGAPSGAVADAAAEPQPDPATVIADVVPMRRRRAPMLLAVAAACVAVLAIATTLVLSLNRPSDTDRIRAASDVVEVELGISDVTVFVSQSEGGIAVEGDMPAPAEGKEYQLWVVPADGSAPIPGPTMGGGETDAAWLTDLEGAGAIAVSLEPEGGSTTPTEVLAAVEL